MTAQMETTMKKMAFPLLIATLTLTSAFAQDLNGHPQENQCRDQLAQSLQTINNLTIQLNQCILDNQNGGDRQDSRLDQALKENIRLTNENADLRRQITELQNDRNGHTLGFFSYAGCIDYAGNVDLKYILSAEGKFALEAETTAKQNTNTTYSCNYGVQIVKTEEIRFPQSNNYCVAGCVDYSGNIDQKFIKSGMGRNTTEAQYNAIKSVQTAYSCNYGVKIQACQ